MTVSPQPPDKRAELETELENAFINFLRTDGSSRTTVSATMATQHFTALVDTYVAQAVQTAVVNELKMADPIASHKLAATVQDRLAQLQPQRKEGEV